MTTQSFTPPASLPAYALSSLNSLSHGGSAESLFILGENPADFYHEMDEAFERHQPSQAEDSHIVTESVKARWFLSRRHRAHARCEHHLHAQSPDPIHWTEAQLNKLNLVDRYKTQAERAFRRSLSNLQSIRKETFSQERWREQLALQKEKTEMQHHKFEFAVEKYNRPLREAAAQAAKQAADKRAYEAERAQHEAAHAPIQTRKEFGGCAIVQKLCIHMEDDQTVIGYIKPSNKKVRQIIAHRASYAEPPIKVVRNYFFTEGIPEQYEFLIDEHNPRPIEDACGTQHQMNFDEYHELAETEDRIIATQPKQKDDPDDE